jgi:hypothetical protein
MKALYSSIKLQGVVYRLGVIESTLEGFEDLWKQFLTDVYEAFGGENLAGLPFYAMKYTHENLVGIEMYAPLHTYEPVATGDFRHITYFEIAAMLGTKIPQGTENQTQEVLEDIRQYLIDNKLIQTSPVFFLPEATEDNTGYTEVLVAYRSRELAEAFERAAIEFEEAAELADELEEAEELAEELEDELEETTEPAEDA